MRELKHGAVEVGINPTLICDAIQDVSSVLVQNTGDVPVFVGSGDVSVDGSRRGLMIKPGDTQHISSYLHDSSPIFGVVDESALGYESQTATVVYLTSH